jgi:hypothetical protein
MHKQLRGATAGFSVAHPRGNSLIEHDHALV